MLHTPFGVQTVSETIFPAFDKKLSKGCGSRYTEHAGAYLLKLDAYTYTVLKKAPDDAAGKPVFFTVHGARNL